MDFRETIVATFTGSESKDEWVDVDLLEEADYERTEEIYARETLQKTSPSSFGNGGEVSAAGAHVLCSRSSGAGADIRFIAWRSFVRDGHCVLELVETSMAHDLEACRVRIHLPSGLSFRAEGVRVFEQSSDDGRQRRIAVGIVTSANTAHVLTFPAHAVSSDGLWLPKRKSTLSFDESGKGSSLGRSMSSLFDVQAEGDEAACVCWCASSKSVGAAFGMISGAVECLVWKGGEGSRATHVRMREATLMGRLWRGIKSTVSIESGDADGIVAISAVGSAGALVAVQSSGIAKTWSLHDQRVVSSWDIPNFGSDCTLFASTIEDSLGQCYVDIASSAYVRRYPTDSVGSLLPQSAQQMMLSEDDLRLLSGGQMLSTCVSGSYGFSLLTSEQWEGGYIGLCTDRRGTQPVTLLEYSRKQMERGDGVDERYFNPDSCNAFFSARVSIPGRYAVKDVVEGYTCCFGKAPPQDSYRHVDLASIVQEASATVARKAQLAAGSRRPDPPCSLYSSCGRCNVHVVAQAPWAL